MYQYGSDFEEELDPQDNENWLGDGWIAEVTLNMTDPEKALSIKGIKMPTEVQYDQYVHYSTDLLRGEYIEIKINNHTIISQLDTGCSINIITQ